MQHSKAMLEKPKNIKVVSARLAKEFKPQKAVIVFIVVLLMASAIFSVIEPLIFKSVLNGFSNYISIDAQSGTYAIAWGSLAIQFAIIFAITGASYVTNWWAQWIGVKIANEYTYHLDNSVKQKLDKMPLSYFDSQDFGDILEKGINDVNNIGSNIYNIVSQGIVAVTMLVGAIAAMFISSWQLSLVVLAFIPLTALSVFAIGIKSQKEFRLYRAKYGAIESQIEESYNGHKLLKAFNKEKDAESRFNETNQAMAASDKKSQFISGFIYPTMRFCNMLGFVAVSVASGLIYADGSNLGTLVAFLMFLNLVSQPFQMIGQISSTFQSVLASSERVFALLDSPEEKPDSPNAISDGKRIEGNIEFSHVSFSYRENEPLIKDMNLKVRQGETVAIVGPTGAGKTTLVNLIMRFYEVKGGNIVLDGIDIRDYKRNVLRGAVGMVLQDTWLFHGSILENIRYGNSDATDEDVINAAKAAHVHHFIETLPEGYHFVLNEDGNNISQGQRQLITIARAICAKPRIMILDEATSSVDTRTEQAIQEAMDDIMKDRTSFVIAHRLSTIKNAKMILVMNHGSIVEMGNHQELLAKNGFYANLYNAQFLGKDTPLNVTGE